MTKAASQHRSVTLLWILLLVSLVFLLVVIPLLEGTGMAELFFHGALTAVFISGALANHTRKWLFRTAIVVAVIATPVTWAASITDSADVDAGQYLIVVLFSVSTAAMLLTALLTTPMPPFQAITGAICVYLLLGLTWAMVYPAIEYAQDAPFSFAEQRVNQRIEGSQTCFSQWIYFSFVTMSTLGYGDIRPRTALAETACWMESVVGQLFIATLITRFVNEMPRQVSKQRR